MTRDRRTLFSIMLADLFVVAGALFVMQDRYQTVMDRLPDLPVSASAGAMTEPADAKRWPSVKPESSAGARPAAPAGRSPATLPASAVGSETTQARSADGDRPGGERPNAPAEAEGQKKVAEAATPAKESSATRNILFSYRNSKPNRVEIIGSFNDWTPQPMKKGKNHTWTGSFSLPPGDYAYNYIVDGKVIRDPNNPRTAPEGRSLLTVKPLSQ